MLIQIALTLTVLLGFCGLVLDVGMMQLKKLQLQNAADAAALGAVYGASSGAAANVWQAAGTSDAALNGFSAANAATVTFAYPPPADAGVGTNNMNAVQATVAQSFNPIFLPGTRTVSAQATALAPYAAACLFLMSQTGHDFSLQVLTSTVSANCPTYLGRDYNIDDHSTAMGGPVYVASNGSGNNIGTLTPSPQLNSTVQNDPLAYLTQPKPGACPQPHSIINNNANASLNRGTYCDLQIQNSTVQMQPGLYIIENNLNINNSTVTGTGVTFFMASTPQALNSIANINNSTITLSAPVAATGNPADGIPGIVFFSDRSLHTGQIEMQINNVYAASRLDGIIYAPGQQVQFVNTPEEQLNYVFQPNRYLGVVADQLYFTNSNVRFESDYSVLGSNSPLRTPGLVQ